MDKKDINIILNKELASINKEQFIAFDPVQFSKLSVIQGIKNKEITALFSALFAWGNRKIVIQKLKQLFETMAYNPLEYIQYSDMAKVEKDFCDFKHRTFHYQDIITMVRFFKKYYTLHDTLEDIFLKNESIEQKLIDFRETFIQMGRPEARTLRHINSPEKKSACKRINLFLKWMVRKDHLGIDLGLWKRIDKRLLIIPLDTRIMKVAGHLGITNSNTQNWKTAVEITEYLKSLDAKDPTKYDLAMFKYWERI